VTTVLLTDITSYKAAVIARHLRRFHPDVRVIATDHRRFARRIHTRHAPSVIKLSCGPGAGEAYAAELARVIADFGVDILIPVNSKEIRVLIGHRDHLGAALSYMGQDALYHRLDDKNKFAGLIDEAGLPQPKNHSTLDAPLPLVVKPAQGSSSKGVMYLLTEAEREALKARLGASLENHVVQDYVEGEGIGFSGYFENGRPVISYAHRRVAEYPVSGGSSVVRERYPYDDLPMLETLIMRLLSVAPWSGFAMFELKRRGPGDFVFIECNPRIWGSIHQGLADSADYFEPLLGKGAPAASQPSTGLRTALLPLNLLAAAGYLRNGNMAKVREMMRSVITQRLDINPISDPMGFLALLMRGA
jgi:hypothetical protein